MAPLIDGSIILLYFMGITALGLYAGRRETSLHEFALGGRRMPWWAVMASIIAAEVSAATFLGAPGEGYANRAMWYVQLVFGLIFGRVLVGYFFLKPYFTYKVYTVYDYLGIRFGPITRNYVSGLFLVMRTLASGTRLFVPSLVMVLAWQLFTQSPGRISYGPHAVAGVLPYIVAIVVLTIITCAYTTFGGIKAVIWTDLIQACLMFGSAIVAVLSLLYHIGEGSWDLSRGLHALGDAVPRMKTIGGYFLTGFEGHDPARTGAWDYFKQMIGSEYTIFSALIASTLTNMGMFGTDQDMVQRMLSAQTYKKSRRSLIGAALMDVPIAAAFTFIGILLYVYYQKDPTYKPASDTDVFGSYILNVMPVGVRGLVLAGVFATAMGSLSAALNALATSATNDWYIPYFARGRSQADYVSAARIFTVIFAALMTGIAGLFALAKVRNPSLRIIPVVLGIAFFIIGPMLGVFLIGLFTRRRGSDLGNVIAITIALAATIYLGDLPHLAGVEAAPRPPLKVSFTWFAMIGAGVVFAVGILFPTPPAALEAAAAREAQASQDDRPVNMRSPRKRAETIED